MMMMMMMVVVVVVVVVVVLSIQPSQIKQAYKNPEIHHINYQPTTVMRIIFTSQKYTSYCRLLLLIKTYLDSASAIV